MNDDRFACLQLFGEEAAAAGEPAPEAAAEAAAQAPMGVSEVGEGKSGEIREASAPAQAPQEQPNARFEAHLRDLERQGEELRRYFPGFDLRQELRSPVFARLTAPGTGISVEDAFYALHRQQIQAAAMDAAARTAARKISNAIRSGARRPVENGTAGTAASVTSFDYRGATREQREALKSRIRTAAARGEKVYPT